MNRIKDFSIVLGIFLFFLVIAAGGAQEPDIMDCSTADISFCEQAAFGVAEDEPTIIVVQHLVLDATIRQTMSAPFLDAYLDGLNQQTTIFHPEADITSHQDEAFLEDVDDYRMLSGTSELIKPRQEAQFIIVANEGQTFIFIMVGEDDESFLTFIEDTIEAQEIEEGPEGYDVLEWGGSSL